MCMVALYKNVNTWMTNTYIPIIIPIYKDPYRSIPIYTDLYRSIPIYTDLYRSIPIYTDLYRSIPIYTDLYRSIPIYTDLYRSIPIYTDLYRSIPIYTDLYRSIPIYTDLYRSIPNFIILTHKEHHNYFTKTYFSIGRNTFLIMEVYQVIQSAKRWGHYNICVALSGVNPYAYVVSLL